MYERNHNESNGLLNRYGNHLKIDKVFLDKLFDLLDLANSELDIMLVGSNSLRFLIEYKIIDSVVSQKLSKNIAIRMLCSIDAEKKLLQKYLVPYIGIESLKLSLPKSSMNLIMFTKDKKELFCFSLNSQRASSNNSDQYNDPRFSLEEWSISDQIPLVNTSVLCFDLLWKEKEIRDNLVKEKLHSDLLFDLLSHDIGNYLQIIQNSLDIVTLSADRKINDKSIVSESIEEITSFLLKAQKAIDKSQLLLQNLRRLERLSTQKNLILIPKNLPEAINNAYNTVRQSFNQSKHNGKNIKFSLSIVNEKTQSMDINIIGEDLLEEIFINLFTNSVKYTLSSDVVIEVFVREYFIAATKYWMVTVSDHGKGIPDSIKSELFDRFYSKAAGSGLGLSIAKTLVERYKGKIWVGDRVYNEYKEGISFGMIFPAFHPEQFSGEIQRE